DGTKPWKHFAHGVSGYDGNEPRIAIILSGLGLGASTTEAAMALPHEISLSFSPYSRRIGQWSATAREKGHDVLLDLPMETERYPAMDPGPYGLLASLGAAENYERLTKIMTKTEGYVGMLTPLREVLTTNANVIAPVVDALSKHGLMLVSSTVEVPLPFSQISQKASVPVLSADLILDERIPESHIKQKLAQLEDLAQKQGYAIGIGRSFPVTVELVGIWAKSLQQKGIRLVPITALAE
ncbi:MAG: divergent polysaccharide deacetylase family protein, partial [Rickettsiales bacterium]